MSEQNITPVRVQDQQAIRVNRAQWYDLGVDNFTQAPAQNPDMFVQFLNILPPATGVLMRRWGYQSFTPKLDTNGNGDGS
jgi:hypothetical protein